MQAKGGFRSTDSVWRFGLPTPNLGGTARTLDEVDGARARSSPASSPATASPSSTTRAPSCSPTTAGSRRAARARSTSTSSPTAATTAPRCGRFYRLTGPQPLLPRFALGNWWSRYHPYSADEYLALMDRFAAEDDPAVGRGASTWTGTSSTSTRGTAAAGPATPGTASCSPTRAAFLAALHERGLATSLNVHPAEGVHAHEERYAAIARRMGVDPDSELPVDFDPADPAFLRGLLRGAAPPARGRGRRLLVAGLAAGRGHPHARARPAVAAQPLPLPRLRARDGRRPLTFSRYAGVGSHRYPIGFSGDTVITWASLDFQPYFTATATNVGYGWWSHDIGGHFFGYKDDELAVRWTQFGVFSPITRLHSSDSPFNTSEPWRFGERAERVMTSFLRLRHRLRALPVHDEPARARRRRAARAADVLRPPGRRGRLPGAQPVPVRRPAARRPDHDARGPGDAAGRGAGLAAAGPLDRRVHRR